MLMIGLPYAAIAVFVAGIVWRYRNPLTITARSSQILESRWLAFGAVPFHAGVITLFLGHLIPLLFPSPWRALVSKRAFLLTVETIGSAAAILCLAGLLILVARRATLRPPARIADYVVLAVLIAQVALGLAVATMHRWGAVWSAGTAIPYLRSIVALQPDPSLVAGVPTLMTLHLAGAWIVLALIPFTRLVHMFSLPLGYLVRPPQKVAW
ncbi:MAG TPA: respiratory nitrate reductase subunit gamma [Thermoanaerobaculia bacterium]|nr:respiratory nitrate reductase subunit gamma [Thermoanaerobaculia bacterium]